MKKILLSLFTVAAIFASCSKDAPPVDPANPTVKEGIPTNATFSFKTGTSTGTRTEPIVPPVPPVPPVTPVSLLPNASSEIDAFKSIDLLIFNDDDGRLITKKVTTGDDIKKLTVNTLSGKKRIFVLVNVGSDIRSNLLDGMTEKISTLTDFYALMTNRKVNETALTSIGDEFIELTTGGSMLMSNGASIQSLYTLHPNITSDDSNSATSSDKEAKNNIEIIVKRAVSKASLTVKKELVEGGKDITTTNGKYNFKALVNYGLCNVNRSVNLTQQFGDDDLPDNDLSSTESPNPSKILAPYYFTTFSDEQMKNNDEFDKYYLDDVISVSSTIDGKFPVETYISENNNTFQAIGNSSYYAIETTMSKIKGEYTVFSYKLLSGEEEPLKTRKYTIVNGVTGENDFKYNEGTGTDAVLSNTFYVMRREPDPGGIELMDGNARIWKQDNRALAINALFITLEAVGIIGTVDNNNSTLGAGIWANNIVDPACLPGGDRYYSDINAFTTVFNLAEASADFYEHENFKPISAAVMGKYGIELSDYFGVYKGAKSYFRLNISETVDNDKIHTVRRNHSYKATLQSFATIGEPTQDDLDNKPETPLDETVTHVTANIKIQAWHDIIIDEGV